MEKPLKIRLHVLSPIHIGCDDVYEPTSFVIDDTKKNLIEFDPMDFVRGLNDKQRSEFSNVCSGDNLLAIMRFVKNCGTNIKGREVDIASDLIAHYKKVLAMQSYDKKAVINQFTMNKTAYAPQSNMPYIPGTSMKGSMRTAYLSALAAVKQIQEYKGKTKDLETQLLKGDFATDPFRMVKVSDLLPVGEVKTKIVYAVNKKKEKSDKSLLSEKGGVYQIFETIQAGAVFEGTININTPEQTAGISEPIKAEKLLLSAHRFYADNLKQEIQPLNNVLGIKHHADISANSKFQYDFKKSAFLIRIGRHSGAEAVTVEGNRNIKIMQGQGKQPKYLDHATTLWLASDSPRPQNNNDLQPFGWAVIEIVPFDVKEGIYSAKKQPDLKPAQDTDTNTSEPVLPKKQVTIISAETILWENAILTWSPGNQILKAAKDNNKAELKLGSDRSIVPEKYHEVLFNKRKEITANISIEKTGNAFKIVSIET